MRKGTPGLGPYHSVCHYCPCLLAHPCQLGSHPLPQWRETRTFKSQEETCGLVHLGTAKETRRHPGRLLCPAGRVEWRTASPRLAPRALLLWGPQLVLSRDRSGRERAEEQQESSGTRDKASWPCPLGPSSSRLCPPGLRLSESLWCCSMTNPSTPAPPSGPSCTLRKQVGRTQGSSGQKPHGR